MDDLSRARDTITRCCATLLDASYTDGIPTETTDVWRTIAADARRDLDALTRWRDSLPVAKVARWDAARGAYVAHDNEGDVCMVATEREQAIAWGYTIEGGPEVDDTAPERLKARREALGWTPAQAAAATSPHWDAADISECETHGDSLSRCYRTRYAAALSAEEQRRAAKPDPLAYTDSPAWDEPAYSTLRQPAPEVVDVPQPVYKLDGKQFTGVAGISYSGKVEDVPQPMVKRFGGVEASWGPRRLDVIALEEVNGDDEPLDVPIPLLRAMLAAIDAQQPAPTTEARPEPHYKVGDWVRVVTGPNSSGRTTPIRVTSVTSAGYVMADGASWAAEHLAPAMDPALHDTARRTVAWLRGGPCGDPPSHYYDLPGHAEYLDDTRAGDAERWAAQLERLLGDA